MPDLSDTVAKCRMGTAKNFTLLLLLYHTQAKSRGMFMVMRFMQKIISNPKDVAYWEEKGWLGKERPWE